MSTSSFRFLFLFVLILTLPCTLATANRRQRRRAHLSTSIRLPLTCNCALGPPPKSTSKCYYIKNSETGECTSRTCKPSYECQSVYTGLICMKRMTTTRIVPIDLHRCVSEQVDGVMYVPCAGKMKPTVSTSAPLSLPHTNPLKRLNTMEIEQMKIENQLRELKKREDEEKEKIQRLEAERLKEEKELEGTVHDEEVEMMNEQQLRSEIEEDEEELAMVKETENQGKSDHYIVVAHRTALGRFENLEDAKNKLNTIDHTSQRGRCIFAVHEGRVKPNPRRIDGVLQNRKFGFNRFSWDQKDIIRMRDVAIAYNDKLDKEKLAREMRNKNGATLSYIVITGNKYRGEFDTLEAAKLKLLRSKPKSSRQRRAIFEIVNGEVGHGVSIVGGEMQEYGMRAGFNKFWWDQDDIDEMYEIAVAYVGVKNGGGARKYT